MSSLYCRKCKKNVEEPVEICNCGSRSFISGELKIDSSEKLTCICGNDALRQDTHMDMTDMAISKLICDKCENPFSIITYRTESEKANW